MCKGQGVRNAQPDRDPFNRLGELEWRQSAAGRQNCLISPAVNGENSAIRGEIIRCGISPSNEVLVNVDGCFLGFFFSSCPPPHPAPPPKCFVFVIERKRSFLPHKLDTTPREVSCACYHPSLCKFARHHLYFQYDYYDSELGGAAVVS